MTESRKTPITKRQLGSLLAKQRLAPIDGSARLYHLSPGYWVYDDMLAALRKSGWLRFAAGFKAGMYGKPGAEHCIKILGMGVGEDPRFFCERGYYLAHERRMLERFRSAGFSFGPTVMPVEDSIQFLKEQGVSPEQAEMRVRRHDLLVMEFLKGVPFATQTGKHVNYNLEIVGFDQDLLTEVLHALERLRGDLNRSHETGLIHNDPMPPNIIFVLDAKKTLHARLVDFELAQDLNSPSPGHVNGTVEELYIDRNVPRNTNNGRHTKNLDQHLLDESMRVVREFLPLAAKVRNPAEPLEGVSFSIPFIGGISFDLGRSIKYIPPGPASGAGGGTAGALAESAGGARGQCPRGPEGAGGHGAGAVRPGGA